MAKLTAQSVSDIEIVRRLKVIGESASMAEASRRLSLARQTLRETVQRAKERGITAMSEPKDIPAPEHTPQRDASSALGEIALKVRNRLKRGNANLEELQNISGLGAGAVKGILSDLAADGFNINEFGGNWAITETPLPAAPHEQSDIPVLISRPDNTFLVGASGDQHIGSKYHRTDTLIDLYDQFEAAGVQAVYNTGNWIDGEARFNKHDLLVHGMEAQCRELARTFPRRTGIVTYAVSGDDHEGWYSQREGVDIGRFAERIMREEGRTDWVHLGHMESYVKLQNYNTGKFSYLLVCHPGGGSAYALSYSVQKLIEVLDGGEKPAVAFYGHYHKLWAGNIRNVWVLQTGTCEDATPFMRKRKIDAHVGGALVGMKQDPETGAIVQFSPTLIRYFNKGYYENRWSYAGPVNLPKRAA